MLMSSVFPITLVREFTGCVQEPAILSFGRGQFRTYCGIVHRAHPREAHSCRQGATGFLSFAVKPGDSDCNEYLVGFGMSVALFDVGLSGF